jgi:hypothetical protein
MSSPVSPPVNLSSRERQEVDEDPEIEEETWGQVPQAKAPHRLVQFSIGFIIVCWLVGLYTFFYLPDTRSKTMRDCYGANMNLTVQLYDLGQHEVDHWTTFGVYSSREQDDRHLNNTEYVVVEIDPEDACNADAMNVTLPSLSNTTEFAGIVARGGCSFAQKMDNLKSFGIDLMIEYDKVHDGSCVLMDLEEHTNDTRLMEESFAGAGISITSRSAYDILNAMKNQSIEMVTVQVSEAERSHGLIFGVVDLSEVGLAVYAMCTIAAGSYWAILSDSKKAEPIQETLLGEDRGGDVHVFTMRNAWSFIFVASGVLLVFFFLSSVILSSIFALIYATTCWESIYFITSGMALHLIKSLVSREQSAFQIFLLSDIASLGFATLLSGMWLLSRQSWDWWIWQDILAFFLIVASLGMIRITSIRVATVLLTLALVYDVFWVYIQPKITGTSSVMVGVVKGLSLPLFVAFPEYSSIGSNVSVSLLGLGDIVLPGLLVAFAARLDHHGKQSGDSRRRSYFIWTMVSYAVGLVACYCALALNIGGQGGQPALLYIIPCILASFYACLWHNDDLHHVWNEKHQEQYQEEQDPLLSTIT